MRLGVTYIEPEVIRRGLTHGQALESLSQLAINTVRIGAYWKLIQPEPKRWDFKTLDLIISHLSKYELDIVLTVGMKAPRWPEFYLPEWLATQNPAEVAKQTQEFIAKVVTRYRDNSSIIAWQVENEPLDSGGILHTHIPLSILQQEVGLVRQLDPIRPIQINFWANNITRRSDYQSVAELCDTVGIDLYYRQPAKWLAYHGPYFFDWQLKRWIAKQSKPVWITELQGDAWEKDHNRKWEANPGSMSPRQLRRSFERAVNLRPEAVLFWGYEYWLWHKQQGRPELWNTAINLCKNQASL